MSSQDAIIGIIVSVAAFVLILAALLLFPSEAPPDALSPTGTPVHPIFQTATARAPTPAGLPPIFATATARAPFPTPTPEVSRS